MSERTDAVNFQSFNSYLAEAVGCTTFSFALNLGILFSFVPAERIKHKDGKPLPQEHQCHFRRTVEKGLVQQKFSRRDIWFVDPDGDNLDAVVSDALDVLLGDAIPWFERFSSVETGLQVLLNDEELVNRLWGIGAPGSPNREFLTGCFAARLGDRALACARLRKALDTGLPFPAGTHQLLDRLQLSS